MGIAIISGASSGIGREFALLLDKENLTEIWAIARNEEMLARLSEELKTPVRAISADLSQDEGIDTFRSLLETEKPDIAWLINAAGFGKFGRYDEIPTEVSRNMIRLNVEALVALTEYCLPFMSGCAKILEIASVAAFQPTPYINVYAASKAFVLSYARALNIELKPRGINVTAVCPFWTKTRFFDRAETQQNKVITKYAAMYDPKDVAAQAVAAAKKGKDLSICGFKARAQVTAVKLAPTKMIFAVWNSQQKFKRKYK